MNNMVPQATSLAEHLYNSERALFNLIEHIKSCNYTTPVKRNKESEKNLMLSSKVELELLLSLSNDPKTNRWLPSVERNGFRISSTWYKINIKHLFYNNGVVNKECVLPDGQKINISQIPELSGTRFILIRLFAIHNKIMYENGKYDDKTATYHLANKLKINTDDLFKEVSVHNNTKWTRSFLNNINAFGHYGKKCYNFLGDQGILLYSLLEMTNSNLEPVLLPVTYWMKTNEIWPIPMNIMPEGKHPLYNLDLIRRYRRAPIFLTEHIEMADGNVSDGIKIWTSWYGGIDAIDYVDWGELYGRTVYYVLKYNKVDAQENIKTALKLYEKFIELENMHFKIITCEVNYENNTATLDADSPKFVGEDSFFVLADKYGVSIPPKLLELKDRFIFIDDINSKSSHQYLVNPSIKEKNLVVLYAPSGVGKSWLAMSIGLAVARGMDVFPGWSILSSHKVLYVAGEMTKKEISDRFFTLKQIYGPTHTWRKNFIARRVYMDLSNRDDQKKIEKDIRDLNSPENNENGQKVSLLILDNLTTLVRNGDFKSSWDQFFDWLEGLKNIFGLTILLVHHENKLGKYLGTSGIKNKTDFLIHASDIDVVAEKLKKLKKKKVVKISNGEAGDADGENDDKPNQEQIAYVKSLYNPEIEMYIHQQKLRGSSKKDFPPIRIALNPDDEKPEWKVTTPVYYQWRNLYTPDSVDQYASAVEVDDMEGAIDAGTGISQGASTVDEKEELGILPKSGDGNKSIESTFKKPFPRIPRIPWKILTLEQKKQVIIDCREHGMTSRQMAEYYDVSKRNIDAVRKITETRDRDFKDKANGIKN